MRNIVLLFVVISCLACKGGVELPKVFSNNPQTIEEAKAVARRIAGQNCTYVGFRSRADDQGFYAFDCQNGDYTLDITQAHLYEQSFNFEKGQEVEFLYSDEYLIKPVYKEDVHYEKNPAYYLWPIPTPVSQNDKLGSPTA